MDDYWDSFYFALDTNIDGNQHTYDEKFTGQQQFDYYDSLERDSIYQSDKNDVNTCDASFLHYNLNDSWSYIVINSSYVS